MTATTRLLDGNVLVALVVTDHVHHEMAVEWFAANGGRFATCPITEGTLIRFLVREGQPIDVALEILGGVRANTRHEFWPDDLPYTLDLMTGVMGHRQVPDANLAGLAREHDGRLATLDKGLAAVHGPDVVDLVGSN
jgi:toxin-antitoxin system PIN domain toxin